LGKIVADDGCKRGQATVKAAMTDADRVIEVDSRKTTSVVVNFNGM
jgi:hypothetical protein